MATVCGVLLAVLIVVGVLGWGGSTLLLDAWWKRQPTDLSDRLMPFQPNLVADEAQRWLDRQQLSGRAPGRVWIRLTDAAAQLGMSRSGFLGLVEREGIAITQQSGRRGVAAARLDAFVKRCRIPPGSYRPELVPYKGHNGPVEVRHLDLLDAVVAGLSWTDARLALEVAVDLETVARWRSAGVPNSYLPALRALRQAVRLGGLDDLDLASLLPWGSRCRLEQARKTRRPRGGGCHGSG
jgi:hypothetical protein